ncbi:hypothetical protein [Cryobacterium inferilacus]|uniref:hypothetical protein n=1 Tax=Cryobacterium inferilacus TaxID=2866629 RepID=UPI001C738511|nr:hypothetical protein [Cryobacterium sp. 1639]
MRINDGSVVADSREKELQESSREQELQERLRALQRRAFSAEGDAAGDAAVAAAIRAVQAEIAAGGLAAGNLAAGDPATGTAVGDPATGGNPPGPVGTDAAGPDGPALVAGPAEAAARPRRLGWGLAVAALLGALVGTGATLAIRPGAEGGVPGDSATVADGVADTEAAGSNDPVLVGQVFERLQTGRDIPRVEMPEAFRPESFRYLGSAGWTDADDDGVTDSPYYAARGPSDVVCLVVVPEGSGYLSTCAPESAYPRAGLRLAWQSTDLHPAVPDGTSTVLDISVAWLRNAMVETRGAGRPAEP